MGWGLHRSTNSGVRAVADQRTPLQRLHHSRTPNVTLSHWGGACVCVCARGRVGSSVDA